LEGIPVSIQSRPDRGMYHALNLALERSAGEIIGHLNADEQYLPGVIDRVLRAFGDDKHLQVLTGDMVVTDAHWNPVAYRRSVRPLAGSAGQIPLSVPTCATFFRREVFSAGLRYRSDLLAIADAVLFDHVVQSRMRWRFDPMPYAVFSLHGENLSVGSGPARDAQRMRLPKTPLRLAGLRLNLWVRRLLSGGYRYRDARIEIYETGWEGRRVARRGRHLGWRWPSLPSHIKSSR